MTKRAASSNQPQQPLAEVFGYKIDDFSPDAIAHRSGKLCPFHNRVAECTKSRKNDPIGVCSIFATPSDTAIVCPVRFREDWIIRKHATAFFFPEGTATQMLREVRLNDANGKAAGNIDVVIVSYDPSTGKLKDFGALEVQAVYTSGTISTPFKRYMSDPAKQKEFDWRGQPNYPRPDYLSSSRKRLAPQLIYKGGILHTWKKKMAVAVDNSFFATLPTMPRLTLADNPNLAWFIYDLKLGADQRYHLTLVDTYYTDFLDALKLITEPKAGNIQTFRSNLQGKLTTLLRTGVAPMDAPTSLDDTEAEYGDSEYDAVE